MMASCQASQSAGALGGQETTSWLLSITPLLRRSTAPPSTDTANLASFFTRPTYILHGPRSRAAAKEHRTVSNLMTTIVTKLLDWSHYEARHQPDSTATTLIRGSSSAHRNSNLVTKTVTMFETFMADLPNSETLPGG